MWEAFVSFILNTCIIVLLWFVQEGGNNVGNPWVSVVIISVGCFCLSVYFFFQVSFWKLDLEIH